ncbi:MAG: heat-inducible transcriptional repressor HrcA [Bryobacteraceae bacterium]
MSRAGHKMEERERKGGNASAHRLSLRQREILCAIVRTYIDNAQPVASSDLCRTGRAGMSAATIRNIMAELDREGYLIQPHTSAGRMPTGKAFEVYVESMPERRVQRGEIGRIQEALYGAGSMERRIACCSHLLAEMTRGVALTAAIPAERQVIEQVHLVALGGLRVLMVLVTQDRMVRNQAVTLDEDLRQGELDNIRNYINAHFSGWAINDARRELRRRLEAESAAYDHVLRRLILLESKGLLEVELEPEVRMEGAGNLVDFELRLTKERLKDLFLALEEKTRVIHLLDRFLEQPSGEVEVRIGLEEEHPSMGEIALIGIQVAAPGGLAAKFAVLGPMRMDYPRAMSAVLHVGRAFGSLPS